MAYSDNTVEQSPLARTDVCFGTRLMWKAGEFRAIASVAACKKAIAVDPDHVEAYINMGFAHGKANQSSQAVAAFEQAIVLRPDYAEAYLGMGAAYCQLGRYPQAIAAFKQAVALRPDCDEGYFGMGSAYR